MRRADALSSRAVLLAACACAFALAGCSRDKPQTPVTFEHLPDTIGLSVGAAVVQSFEPYRMSNGAMRVRGETRLPDSTLLQIAVRTPDGGVSLAMAQVVVLGGRFDTPPLLGDHGPLPKGDYRVEVLAHFNADWQPARVLRATASGGGLRGPGITRARNGDTALLLSREARL